MNKGTKYIENTKENVSGTKDLNTKKNLLHKVERKEPQGGENTCFRKLVVSKEERKGSTLVKYSRKELLLKRVFKNVSPGSGTERNLGSNLSFSLYTPVPQGELLNTSKLQFSHV